MSTRHRLSPALLRAEVARRNLLDFVPWVNRKFARPVHLAPLVDLLTRAAHGEPVRACVSCPPRHAKTETLCCHGIPWYLAQHPDHHVAYVSHSDDMARDKSSRARDVARQIGLSLREDSSSKSHWRLPQGGGLWAGGVGSGVTGHGFQLILCDDPIRNREEAESQTIRQSIHQYFTSTLLTRAEPDCAVIVAHARWHDDDLIGRLRRDPDASWECVNLPALDAQGRPLWPERWPADALDRRRREIGPYDWHSLFLGECRPRGSRLFGPPTWFDLRDFSLDGKQVTIGVDPAASEKTSADWSVAVVLASSGEGIERRAWVLEVLRLHVSVPEFARRVRALQTKWHGAQCAVEAVAGFKALPQILREIEPGLAIVEVHPTGDKFTRAQPVSAAWTDGRVAVPKEAPWDVEGFLAEVRSFTGVRDAHDDCVDALAHAWDAPVPTGAMTACPVSLEQENWIPGSESHLDPALAIGDEYLIGGW